MNGARTNHKKVAVILPTLFLPATTGFRKRIEYIMTYLLNRGYDLMAIVLTDVDLPLEEVEYHRKIFSNITIIKRGAVKHFRPLMSLLKNIYQLISGKHLGFNNNFDLRHKQMRKAANVCLQAEVNYVIAMRHNVGSIIDFLHQKDSIIKIIDPQDIMSEMIFKTVALKSQLLAKLMFRNEQGYPFSSEIKMLTGYDRVIAISESDYDNYKQKISHTNLRLFEACLIQQPSIASVLGKNKMYDLLFIGSNFHTNCLGLIEFLQEVFYQLPDDTTFCIVGSISECIKDKYSSEKLAIIGTVDDLGAYYETARIVVNPMRAQSGLSVKTFEALSYGSLLIGYMDSMRINGLKNGFNCLIANDPKDYAEKIMHYLKNEKERVKIGVNAYEFMKKNYTISQKFKELDEIFTFER